MKCPNCNAEVTTISMRESGTWGCKHCQGYPDSRTPAQFGMPMNGANIVTPAHFDDITHRRIVKEGGVNHVEHNRGRVYFTPK